jgi:TM2 domain-containing membrane protein YozV
MTRGLAAGLTLAVLLCCAGPTAASDAPAPPPASADGLFGFAVHLEEAGEHYRAITEYGRFGFHFPDDRRAPEARYRTGRCLVAGEKWDAAEQAFRDAAADPRDPAIALKAALALADSAYRRGRYGSVPALAQRVTLAAPGSPEAAQARRLGELALVRVGQADAALRLAAEGGDALERDVVADLAVDGAKGDAMSPALAGALSAVLPGSGQLYLGRPKDALVAFVLNGLFIYGAYESAQQDAWGLFAVCATLEVGWYAGNVYGAVSGAEKHNRKAREDRLAPAERRLLISLAPGPDRSAVLSFGLRF